MTVSVAWNRRLNNNTLKGQIPVILTTVQSLQVLWVLSWCLSFSWSIKIYILFAHHIYCKNVTLSSFHVEWRDLSNNKLTGDIPINGSFSLFTPIRLISFLSSIFPWQNSRMTWLMNELSWLLLFHFAVIKIIHSMFPQFLHLLLFLKHHQLLLQVCYMFSSLIWTLVRLIMSFIVCVCSFGSSHRNLRRNCFEYFDFLLKIISQITSLILQSLYFPTSSSFFWYNISMKYSSEINCFWKQLAGSGMYLHLRHEVSSLLELENLLQLLMTHPLSLTKKRRKLTLAGDAMDQST